MEAEDIERYLTELGTELKNRGLKKPVRVLLIGGAYMLLFTNAPRSTKDIDIFWPSKSLQDVTKTWPIVLYCSRKYEFGRASKHSTS